MSRLWSACGQSGCDELAPPGRSRCAKHGSEDTRPSASARGYDGRWARRRAAFLKGKRCAACGMPATVADHHPASRRELVARGVADPDGDCHLVALCARCHGIAGTLFDGAWGHTKRGWNLELLRREVARRASA